MILFMVCLNDIFEREFFMFFHHEKQSCFASTFFWKYWRGICVRQLTANSLLFNCTVIFLRVTFQSHDFKLLSVTFQSSPLNQVFLFQSFLVHDAFSKHMFFLQLYSKKLKVPICNSKIWPASHAMGLQWHPWPCSQERVGDLEGSSEWGTWTLAKGYMVQWLERLETWFN